MIYVTLNLFQDPLCKTDADPVHTGQHDLELSHNANIIELYYQQTFTNLYPNF